ICVGAEAEPSSARHTPQFAAAERSTMNPKIFGRAPGTVLSMNDTMPPSRPWVIPELGMVVVDLRGRRGRAVIGSPHTTVRGGGTVNHEPEDLRTCTGHSFVDERHDATIKALGYTRARDG